MPPLKTSYGSSGPPSPDASATVPLGITAEEFARVLHTTVAAIYKGVERGRLPKPAPTGTKRMIWAPCVVNAFLIGGLPAVEALGGHIPALPTRRPGRPRLKPLRVSKRGTLIDDHGDSAVSTIGDTLGRS